MYPECQYFYAILNACCNSPQSKIITSCVWCISLIVLIWPVRNDFDLFPFFKCVFLFRPGNYRTQLYDKQKEEYLPATQGLGMFVEVKDPDEKVCLNGCPESNKSPIVIVFHHHLICVSFFCLSGDPVPPVWIWGQVYLHLPHTWRASNLPALKFLQICSVCRWDACKFLFTFTSGLLKAPRVPLALASFWIYY